MSTKPGDLHFGKRLAPAPSSSLLRTRPSYSHAPARESSASTRSLLRPRAMKTSSMSPSCATPWATRAGSSVG